MSEEEEHAPRWDLVKKSYDDVEDSIDKMVSERKMNFLEISMVFMMIKEKLNQEKFGLYLEYVKEEANQSAKDSGLYR